MRPSSPCPASGQATSRRQRRPRRPRRKGTGAPGRSLGESPVNLKVVMIEFTDGFGGLTPRERQRYSRHLLLPEVGEEGQRRLKAARVLCVGAGGLGIAGGALSRRGRRRHPRPRRLRRRRLQQPPAADHPRHARRRPIEARVRAGADRGAEPRGPRRDVRRALLGRERQDARRRVRRHRRRHRQLPRALPRERRVRDVRQAERVGQHLPVRRAGVRVRGARRPVLSLPAPGAAAAGPRAELRGSGRARRAARRHRHHPGDRSAEVDPRDRRSADRPVPRLRRAQDAVPRSEAAEGSRLPGLRRPSDDHHAPGIGRVVRRAAAAGPNARCAS